MKLFFLLAFLATLLLHADELSFGNTSNRTKGSSTAQALQFHVSNTMEGAQDSLKKAPAYYRHHIHIHQEGEYYITRYQNPKYPTILPWILRDFKKAGFSDSFVVPALTDAVLVKTLNPQSLPLAKSPSVVAPQPPSSQFNKTSLSQHDQTRLITDVQKAYEQHDFTQAIIYYEMMIAADMKDRQILLNLAYLYGREGSFALLEKKIEGKRGVNDYLYSYGVGALEAGRSDLYNTLSPYLIYDKSGKLSMLCGYFFEQEQDPKRAAAFYKMAYEAAPSDPHILYAYARSVDISGNKSQALYLYTQVSQLESNFEPLRAASQSRIQNLRNTP